jgi:predicted Fe-Mo cluster-binding NifX family protein
VKEATKSDNNTPSMSNTGLKSDVCAHYGSCEHFTIVDVCDRAITGIRTISNRALYGEHNCAAPSRILKSQNVDVLIVSGIGARPLMSLAEDKIKVLQELRTRFPMRFISLGRITVGAQGRQQGFKEN